MTWGLANLKGQRKEVAAMKGPEEENVRVQEQALAPKGRWSAALKAAQSSREMTTETDGCWRPGGQKPQL